MSTWHDAMGQIHVPVTLRNTREEVLAQLGHLAPDHVHTLATEALVDTGAQHLVLPQALAEQLALVGLRPQAVTMADGRDGVYPQTEPVTIELLGRSFALSALVMGATVLLGALVLEGLDLAVDPARQGLMPNLGTWDQPRFRA
jgi:clan AA aspartic protease